jgi:hypothetical protein
MIAVRIPKEIRAYKEKIFLGLTLRQLLACASAMVLCIPLYIFGRKVINEEVLSWMIVCIAAPIACFGFFRYNGMPFETFVAIVITRLFLYPFKRTYRSTCCFSLWSPQSHEIEKKESASFKRVLSETWKEENDSHDANEQQSG